LELERLMNYDLDLSENSNGSKEERMGVERIRLEDVEHLWSIPE
jgi:hypothetical protein